MLFSGWELGEQTSQNKNVGYAVFAVLALGLVSVRASRSEVMAKRGYMAQRAIEFMSYGICAGAASMGGGYTARKWWVMVEPKM